MRYSTRALVYCYLRDLIVEIRCARRDGFLEYAVQVEAEFRALWPRRRHARVNRFGLPH